jgi:hypothetical protein
MEKLEFKAILKQLEFTKKFSDGGLIRVAVVEPISIIRAFMKTNILMQKRKTPIRVFKKDSTAVNYCTTGLEKKKSKKEQEKAF